MASDMLKKVHLIKITTLQVEAFDPKMENCHKCVEETHREGTSLVSKLFRVRRRPTVKANYQLVPQESTEWFSCSYFHLFLSQVLTWTHISITKIFHHFKFFSCTCTNIYIHNYFLQWWSNARVLPRILEWQLKFILPCPIYKTIIIH